MSVTKIVIEIPIVGRVVDYGFELFEDAALQVPLTQIDWGDLQRGTEKDVTIYGKNTGNLDLTLSQEIQDVVPIEAADDLVLTWNYDGHAIIPQEVFPIILTLSVLGTAPLDVFSFSLVITAT